MTIIPRDNLIAAPAGRSVEGHPIGNDRIGTIVWVRPAARQAGYWRRPWRQ
jgi:hypothetical protein